MGSSKEGIAKIWQPSRPSKIGYSNPSGKSLGQISEEIFRKQLHPRYHLTELQDKFLGNIHRSLTAENLSALGKVVSSSSSNKRVVFLLQWTQATLLEGATNVFSGDALLARNPGLLDNFSDFDERSWQLSYRISSPWTRKMQAAKQRSLEALTAYFMSLKHDRPGACWLVEILESEMRMAGIRETDMAANLLMAYWVINGNAWKVCFWIMAYLVEDPVLCSAIRAEVTAIGSAARYPNKLSDYLDRCPQLVAIYQETLRVVTSSVLVRNAVKPLELGGKLLRPGSRVFITYRQILMNEQMFGLDAANFDAARFLKNQSLSKSQSFRPFVSGTTHCPGRFLAQKEILTFFSLALSRFDVSKTHGASIFPRLELKKPCLGVMAPIRGDDIIVTVIPFS